MILEASEAYLLGIFEESNLAAIYSKRVTVIPRGTLWFLINIILYIVIVVFYCLFVVVDMKLALRFRSRNKWRKNSKQ